MTVDQLSVYRQDQSFFFQCFYSMTGKTEFLIRKSALKECLNDSAHLKFISDVIRRLAEFDNVLLVTMAAIGTTTKASTQEPKSLASQKCGDALPSGKTSRGTTLTAAMTTTKNVKTPVLATTSFKADDALLIFRTRHSATACITRKDTTTKK